jgi:hypothetical protein
MRAIALPIVILMLTATFAGCVGGDPDGNDNSGIDMEILNEMIDDNLQDFINNTSVTINQEIHYHNNTTYIVDDGTYQDIVNNNFNNTTNVDGGGVENNNYDQSENTWNIGGASFGEGVNGSVSGGGMMFVAHIEFSAMDLFPDYETTDHRNNTFTYNYTYYDYLTNSERTDEFSYSCQVFYLIGSLSNGSSFQVSYWQDNNNYWNAWDNEYNSTIADMLSYAGGEHYVRMICDEDYIAAMPIVDSTSGYEYNFLNIDIPQGYAIRYIQLNSNHQWFGCYSYYLSHYRCTDSSYQYDHSTTNFYNFSEGIQPWSNDADLYGGWENITISFDVKLVDYGEYQGYTLPYSDSEYYEGVGVFSIWPSSVYEFTLYYEFVPVIPVE